MRVLILAVRGVRRCNRISETEVVLVVPLIGSRASRRESCGNLHHHDTANSCLPLSPRHSLCLHRVRAQLHRGRVWHIVWCCRDVDAETTFYALKQDDLLRPCSRVDNLRRHDQPHTRRCVEEQNVKIVLLRTDVTTAASKALGGVLEFCVLPQRTRRGSLSPRQGKVSVSLASARIGALKLTVAVAALQEQG